MGILARQQRQSSPNREITQNNSVPTNARLHLNFLDGIRAIAALYVLMHHLWLSQRALLPQGWPTGWLAYGHLAVDVFIVLSGFCLMLPVARFKELRGGARHFFARRARRILPPVYACIVLCLPINILVSRLGHHHQTMVSTKGLLVNLLLLKIFFLV